MSNVYVIELVTGELLVSKIESQYKNEEGKIVYKLSKPVRLIINPIAKKVEMSIFPIDEIKENSLIEISEDKLMFKPILASERLSSIYIQSTSNLVIPQQPIPTSNGMSHGSPPTNMTNILDISKRKQ